MNRRFYRIGLVAALIALTGLLFIQVYGFIKAYRLEEKQFNEKVNVALREVADGILTINHQHQKRIDPVVQTASNTYFVPIHHSISYRPLDSLLRKTFTEHNILQPFSLTVYTESDSVILGSFYNAGPGSSDDPTCMGRDEQNIPMNFAVTFPVQNAHIVGAMDLWIFTAATFIAILILFAFMITDQAKQKKLALMKNDFLSNMTHELQTPITNISMASEVLLRNPDIETKKKSRYLEIIQQENQRLKHQVEQVLQTAAMDKGEFLLTRQTINLNHLIGDIVEKFRFRVEQRFGLLKSELKAANPHVAGDALHLTNIFFNLLDNAEKYSRDEPNITVSSHDSESGVMISIEDHGIGMSDQSINSIFDQFYRASSGNIHDVKGFGLGLTYVKKIVEAHHGMISVKSRLNYGSTFMIVLPNQVNG
jgi:two-component system, OmpR family, phosphate regulon sensor histidine kinase PhoR